MSSAKTLKATFVDEVSSSSEAIIDLVPDRR